MASNYERLERLTKTDDLKMLNKDQVLMAVGRAIQNFEHEYVETEQAFIMNPDTSIHEKHLDIEDLKKRTEPILQFIQDLMSSIQYFGDSYPHPCVLYSMEDKLSDAVNKRLSQTAGLIRNVKRATS